MGAELFYFINNDVSLLNKYDMCGIIAVYSRHNDVSPAGLQKAIASLEHRGPDSHGSWISPDRRAGVGHVRLSIMDPHNGHQPLRSEKGNVAVVNGEFYGYDALLNRFRNQGITFSSNSDSEVVLPLYEEAGTDSFSQLRGEFAFVLYQPEVDELIAVRDRFGIKPLYYYETESSVYLASEIKALLALGVPAVWNQKAAFYAITNYSLLPGESLFEGIKQVPPGHYLKIQAGTLSVRPYWNLNYNHTEDDAGKRTDQELISAFRTKFFEAVETRLVADLPVGVYLSGGIDSCSVLGAASTLCRKPLAAFSIDFDDNTYSERTPAAEMAKFARAEHHLLSVSEKDIVNSFERAVWNCEYFFINTHGIAKFLLSKFVRDAGYKTVLTGDGSDELLGGYAAFRQDYLLDAYPDQQRRAEVMAKMIESNKASRGLLISESSAKVGPAVEKLGFLPSFWEPMASSTLLIRSLFRADLAHTHTQWAGYQELLNAIPLSSIQQADHLHKSMYVWTKSAFPNYLLGVLGDRTEMAHSIEARTPFLDHPLAEFLQSVPSRLKINQSTEKYILREALKDYITDTVYRRQKHPFLAPPVTLHYQGKLFQYYREIIEDDSFLDVPMFDHAKVRSLFSKIAVFPDEIKQRLDPVFTMIVSMTVLSKTFSMQDSLELV